MGMEKQMEKFSLAVTDKQTLCGYSWLADSPKASVCIVHGIGEYALRYQPIAEFLQSRGYSVFAADMPGHGYNQDLRGHAGGRKALMRFVESLIQKAQAVYPDLPVFVYGHSMGGNIALTHRMVIGKVAGYIITSPWLKIINPYSKFTVLMMKLLSKIAPSHIVRTQLKDEDLYHRDTPVEPDPMMHGDVSIITGLDRIADAEQILKNAAKPGPQMLLMHGSDDRICLPEASRELKASIGENCTYIEWKGCYHELHHEKSIEDRYLPVIAEWLDNRV